MAIFGALWNKKGSASKGIAGKRFVITRPKFGLVRSWISSSLYLHVLVLNAAAFLADLAEKGENVHEDGKDLWANLQGFLMVVSTTLAATNSLHEPSKKEKSWIWFKLLLLAAMVGVNYRLLTVAYSKKGDKVSKGTKRELADHQMLLYFISSVLSGIASFVKLVPKQEEPALDDQDLELGKKPLDRGYPSTLPEYKDALADQESTLRTLMKITENLWSTVQRLTRENGLLLSWIDRAEYF